MQNVCGIYLMNIGDKLYVGKDMAIDKQRRYKEHMRLLKKGTHYNRYLQSAFNKYGKVEYSELERCHPEDAVGREVYWISKLNSRYTGMNLTLGGEGGCGRVVFAEEKQKARTRISGEKNPMAKLKNSDVEDIISLVMDGKSNDEISSKYNIHTRYVSLIRHKKRFISVWDKVDPDNLLVSPKSGGVDYLTEDEKDNIRHLIVSTGLSDHFISKMVGRTRPTVKAIRLGMSRTCND